VANRELEAYFQPQVALDTRAVLGAEALLRCVLPGRRVLPAASVVPFLARSHLIVEAGAQMLEQVCLFASDRPDLRNVSINVCLAELERENYPERVHAAVAACRVPAERLELELGSPATLLRQGNAQHALRRAAALGVRLALDNVGTDDALRALCELPISTLKLDAALVRAAPTNSRARSVVQAIVTLARALSLRVVAQGVEREVEAHLMTELGCDAAQGWLFGTALPHRRALAPCNRGPQLNLRTTEAKLGSCRSRPFHLRRSSRQHHRRPVGEGAPAARASPGDLWRSRPPGWTSSWHESDPVRVVQSSPASCRTSSRGSARTPSSVASSVPLQRAILPGRIVLVSMYLADQRSSAARKTALGSPSSSRPIAHGRRRFVTDSTQKVIPISALLVIGGSQSLIDAVRRGTSSLHTAAVVACDVRVAATRAAELRPAAIVMSEEVYAFDSAEFDALARDVRAQLIVVASDARGVLRAPDALRTSVRMALERRQRRA
jgi:EAL domain-containing protein (putative c-di-GMP-specific phosphodiesterase class I)